MIPFKFSWSLILPKLHTFPSKSTTTLPSHVAAQSLHRPSTISNPGITSHAGFKHCPYLFAPVEYSVPQFVRRIVWFDPATILTGCSFEGSCNVVCDGVDISFVCVRESWYNEFEPREYSGMDGKVQPPFARSVGLCLKFGELIDRRSSCDKNFRISHDMSPIGRAITLVTRRL